MEPELVFASSSMDAGIGCWDLHSGAEGLRYRSCASAPHGLVSVGSRFLASSQLREPSSSSGSVLYWSWNKPHVEVKSFPAEPINPLVSNMEGTYLVGGGVSGDIYFWEVNTGRLLKKWHAHYRAVTCLVYCDGQSLLISGAEDGSVRVWSLVTIFDKTWMERAKHLHMYNFAEHTLRVTDIAMGHGGPNAIIISASEDRTCKVWSLARGELLRNIVFPSIIDAIALDPVEYVFYAGGRDGKIYIAALNAPDINNNYGMYILGSLADQSKAVTSLAFDVDGVLLISGYEDGMVRVWDTRTRNIIRIFKHAKGPVNNILVMSSPLSLNPRMVLNSQSASVGRHGSTLAPPLEKYTSSADEIVEIKTYLGGQSTCVEPLSGSYISAQIINNQIKELQQQGSSATDGLEVEQLKNDLSRSMQMAQKWKKMYENLHQFCVNELMDGDQDEGDNGKST
ncbi:protein ROOT INITIATION DEFECTIVE 3 [Diospyros lotus]|uniref:protein ROOT INITIATION DEFECTIVE 3 n=1 Tax=Diospyros lotus TaxID=55363 RepID=UPI0022559478|nr:protein ROOT INITIATION DEFECTIVE 3 [Diospyros lotus]